MSVLRVRNLSKAFGGVHAVENVSFDVGEGEFLALIGPKWRGEIDLFQHDQRAARARSRPHQIGRAHV